MKQASKFEKFAARSWNLLNEGKPFTPIFVVGIMIIFYNVTLFKSTNLLPFLLAFGVTLPLFIMFFMYDFPLFIRNYLWLPLIGYLLIWQTTNISLLLTGVGFYFFFTVIFWGTIYYHLRIGTTLLNFTRFWKLVLKNSDSTSGNAQEQLPKFLLLLSFWDFFFQYFKTNSFAQFQTEQLSAVALFIASVFIFTWILHTYLFDWKPKEIAGRTKEVNLPKNLQNEKVVVIVIDGMRKDRFEQANTPFLDRIRMEGTEYTNMETVYPARTVVCFSSMFTGTYPREHGIKSNMVYKLGINVESIFDSLRKVGKKGRMLAVAHLVDAMGSDVETYTAVTNNDEVDRKIIERAKKMMKEQDPDLLIAQLISTDQTGHSRGVHYDEYIAKIEEADMLINEYVDWLKQEGKFDNTTLIICADHGQADGIGGHGHLDEGERFVPFFMYGPSINKGVKVDKRHSLVSVAPTLASLLGAPLPSHSKGPVLVEALNDGRKTANEKTESDRISTSL
ncbi:sulfatase [Lottiidibacillus patelloidae]|uniref:Sulfatase n=1 Tax=Lottiidibacillus patelloidae TaxID=2670334 RepID=A0A263BVY2_9BACI|nr:alkaline phosphatase family protein [Lottiidibacillus patelloidae]OZM57911.1 sulfatase [Lottiidibacillus patelloidae]